MSQKDSDKLLPCPFCGSTDIDAEGWTNSEGRSGPACNDCGASAGDLSHTSEDNVKAWNTRQPTEPSGNYNKEQTQAINEVLMSVADINLELPAKVADDVRNKVMKIINLLTIKPVPSVLPPVNKEGELEIIKEALKWADSSCKGYWPDENINTPEEIQEEWKQFDNKVQAAFKALNKLIRNAHE